MTGLTDDAVQQRSDSVDTGIDVGARVDIQRVRSDLRRHSRGPLQPAAFTAKREDGGITFRIIDRAPVTDLTGAVRYDVYWCEQLDLSSNDTIAAGYARATNVLSIPAPGREGADATRALYGSRYMQGYFFCVGVDSANVPGDPTPPLSMHDTSNSGGYPDDVTHQDASESGEIHNSVTYSVVSFIYQAPLDPRFAGVKFFLKDYPVINEIYEVATHWYVGQPGGTGQDGFKLEVGRRPGTGDITIVGTNISGVGTTFLAEMNPGDYLEARGHVQQIASVLDNDTADFGFGAWAGDDVTSLSSWWIIPQVTLYFVSIASDGSHREDIESAPSVTLVLDGLVSAPVAPVLTGNKDSNGVSTYGETTVLEFDQLVGTDIKQYHAYRGEGAGVAFADCAEFAPPVAHDPHALGAGHHQIQDKDFTITQKELNQVWSYYLVAENWREQRSSPSSRVDVACRLNSPPSGDPTIPARNGVLNLLWNAPLIGTAGNNVDNADASQKAWKDGSPAVPGGWTQWHSTVSGAAATRAKHYGGDQVKFAPPGGVLDTDITDLYQKVNGWSAAVNPIIRAGSLLTLQVLVRHDGTLPDGSFDMFVQAYNGGVLQENCQRRYRDPADDALKWYSGGTTPIKRISGADIKSTWNLYFSVFRTDSTLTVDEIRTVLRWTGGTVGNVYVTQPMLSYGEELANWTGQMIDTGVRYPQPGNPVGDIGDGPGRRGEGPIEV